MLTQCNSLPPRVPFMNVRAFLNDYGQYVAQREVVDVEVAREAQALDAAEFEHGPAICTEEGCTELACIAYHRAITNAAIVAAYPHGFSLS